jgi:hypothetical protein
MVRFHLRKSWLFDRQSIAHHPKKLIQGHRFGASDVVSATSCALLAHGRGEQIRLNDIRDIAEVTRRLTVAENAATLAAQETRNPAGDHRGGRPGGILALPENVEVP